jgi:tRNA(fMet)-specific endonuclease VapC
MYLLDANAWIAMFRLTSPSLLARLKQHPAGDIVLCSVVLAELRYGVCRGAPQHRMKNEQFVTQLQARHVSIPLDDAAAIDSGELRAYLAAAGKMIGPYDLLIASIARTRGLTLITHNTAEFSRVPNLLIEDWQVP